MLDNLLERFGIKKIEDLTDEERATYLEWTKILATRDVTIEDLKVFLPQELERARGEAAKYDNSPNRDLFLKAYCHLLQTITQIITTPAKQRESLRAYLKTKHDIEI